MHKIFQVTRFLWCGAIAQRKFREIDCGAMPNNMMLNFAIVCSLLFIFLSVGISGLEPGGACPMLI